MSLIDRARSAINTLETVSQEVDRVIATVAPSAAVKRRRDRQILAAYEAARPGRTRRMGLESRGPDIVNTESAESMRSQARHLDENYDLITGAIDTLVMRTVGPKGIMVEPMAKDKSGQLHKEFNRQLNELHRNWWSRPDVTGELSGAMCEQLAARTWIRDGEEFTQMVMGSKPGLQMSADVPFWIELLEPDLVPHIFEDKNSKVFQGVKKNAWRRPVAYYVYKEHPGEFLYRLPQPTDLKSVPADNILHLKLVKRIGQTRGITLLHSVITRIEDIKDYEESERIAARIAAAAAFYIKKGSPDTFTEGGNEKGGDRSFKIQPGVVFDRLQAGEEVGSIQSNRPSALLEPFRNAMVKMVAAGLRISYSSAAKDYNGTYSAQRQELVEQWDHYLTLQNWFIDSFRRPVYENFVRVAIASGRVELPDDLDISTVLRAHYQGPAMPWIDPDKESKANERNNRAGYTTRSAIIRSRNENPLEVDEQLATERKREDESGLILTSNAAHDAKQLPEPDGNNEDPESEDNENPEDNKQEGE